MFRFFVDATLDYQFQLCDYPGEACLAELGLQ